MSTYYSDHNLISEDYYEDVAEIFTEMKNLDRKYEEALKNPEKYLDSEERTIDYFSILNLENLRTDEEAKRRWDYGGIGFADPYFGFLNKDLYEDLSEADKIKWTVVTDCLWRTIYASICYLDQEYAVDIAEDVNDIYNSTTDSQRDLRRYFSTNLHRTETGRYGMSEWLRTFMLR